MEGKKNTRFISMCKAIGANYLAMGFGVDFDAH